MKVRLITEYESIQHTADGTSKCDKCCFNGRVSACCTNPDFMAMPCAVFNVDYYYVLRRHWTEFK